MQQSVAAMQLIRAHSNWCQASDGSPLTPRPAFPARMICHSPSLRSSLLPRSPHPSHQSDSLSLSLLISKPKDYMPTLKHFSTKTLCSTDPWLWKWTNLGINETSSFHWLSSSIFTYCLFVCLSRIGNTSSHLRYMMFQTIQTIYFLWGYDPGNMSVSFIAELSPVYCCLVHVIL